jgi:membrane protease subunit HflC
VATTEQAVVITLGKIDANVRMPGLHFRWPYPIQKVMKYDTRLRCYDGNIGKLEETPTCDGKNITVSIYTVFRIKDLIKFQSAGGSITTAEDQLGILMRSAKGAIIGKYRFDQLVNSDPAKIQIKKMESDMLKMVAESAFNQYGLEVVSVNIRTIGVPDEPAKAIAERMISERKTEAEKYKSQGEVKAKKIMTDADNNYENIKARAEAEAKKIKAEGDMEAAKYYAVFQENPELAIFLRKLESMKKLMGSRTTLILDTNSAPFDILKYGTSVTGETTKK